jgi:hypothetical protein
MARSLQTNSGMPFSMAQSSAVGCRTVNAMYFPLGASPLVTNVR